MDLSTEQQIVHDMIMDEFIPDGKPLFLYNGAAGTGKTTVLSKVRDSIKKKNRSLNVAFCTPTGKAAVNLKNKLEGMGVNLNYSDFIGTIHRLIYYPFIDERTGKILYWIKKTEIEEYDFIFLDESSMVDLDTYNDLASYNIPIIATGDESQLQPIFGNGMIQKKPIDFKLTEIHRQAKDNPIIMLSDFIRKHKNLPRKILLKDVFKIPWSEPKCKQLYNDLNPEDDVIVLARTNKTRTTINKDFRDKLKYRISEPYPNERVICLKNNYISGVMNGQTGTVLWLMHYDENLYELTVKMDGEDALFYGLVYKGAFMRDDYSTLEQELNHLKYTIYKDNKDVRKRGINLFDFAYCITVHKSQGSEWRRICLVDEPFYYDDYSKWLYTAVTRAKEKLFIIEGFGK